MTDSVMRRMRYLVVESLYESDNSDHAPEPVFERVLKDAAAEDPALLAPGPSGFGRGALRGVVRRVQELDRYIQDGASRYPLNTMAVVDRNILRLAIWELLTDDSAPVAAVVNEAVELAHRYSGESSPGFINGVLRTVSERIRAEKGPASPAPQEAPSSIPLSQEN
jgi:transcription antitermination protein NusB